MRKLSLSDGADAFDVALFEAAAPSAAVLFAVGGGGNPQRIPTPCALAPPGKAHLRRRE
jgi:hypothetical protein